MAQLIPLEILAQPDDVTCGPTCLHAIYQFYDDAISIGDVIREVRGVKTGGTLAVHLGCHALSRGYRALLITNNLQMFDPTWFKKPGIDLAEKLRMQAESKTGSRFKSATKGYLRFLENGGRIIYKGLSGRLIRGMLQEGLPLVVGLSATYLYNSAREDPETNAYDDIGGYPSGHFVVLRGYDRRRRKVMVADPYALNPLFQKHYYDVNMNRLIHAILLGIVTFDANLLVVTPTEERIAHIR